MLGVKKVAFSGVSALARGAAASATVRASARQDHRVTLFHRARHKDAAVSVTQAAVAARMVKGDTLIGDCGECVAA